jgi:hypothetical protein
VSLIRLTAQAGRVTIGAPGLSPVCEGSEMRPDLENIETAAAELGVPKASLRAAAERIGSAAMKRKPLLGGGRWAGGER